VLNFHPPSKESSVNLRARLSLTRLEERETPSTTGPVDPNGAPVDPPPTNPPQAPVDPNAPVDPHG
jgi:hypothetical protein